LLIFDLLLPIPCFASICWFFHPSSNHMHALLFNGADPTYPSMTNNNKALGSGNAFSLLAKGGVMECKRTSALFERMPSGNWTKNY
jgi:hypothetical protein